jgi:hypothetical protein
MSLGTEGVGVKDFDVLSEMKAQQDERNAKKKFDYAAARFIVESGMSLWLPHCSA